MSRERAKERQEAYLRGRIEQKKEDIEKFIKDLNDCLRLEDDGFGNKISCDCESNVIEKLEKWQNEKNRI